MKYDKFELLKQYVEKGWVIKQDHPTLPLSIYNYSRGVQYEKLWDPITLECRGLVLDSEGNLIAKPFSKFFNYEELTEASIPKQPFEVFEKMDGSLGICFYYERELSLDERMHYWFHNSKPNRDVCDYVDELENSLKHKELDKSGVPTKMGEWHIATRGSFTSEQAIKGRELLNKYKYKYLATDCTYLFEIIYPENRIVVDYGNDEELVMLTSIQTNTGEEYDIYDWKYDDLGFKLVKKYDGVTDFKTLKGMISNDAEGYVIRFKRGMRMKIKGDEYVRLHRILTNFSTTDIWELLRTDGNLNEFLDRVPDEFDNWVRMTVLELKAHFENIKFRSSIDFEYYKVESNGDKKEFALAIKDNEYRSILFSMWDGKSYEDTIWKMIKPKWSKPFKKDNDN